MEIGGKYDLYIAKKREKKKDSKMQTKIFMTEVNIMSSCKAYGYWGGIGAAVSGTRLYKADDVDREVRTYQDLVRTSTRQITNLVEAIEKTIPFTPTEVRREVVQIMTRK